MGILTELNLFLTMTPEDSIQIPQTSEIQNALKEAEAELFAEYVKLKALELNITEDYFILEFT